MSKIFGDETWFDIPPFFSSKFFEKNYSTILKWGLKFHLEYISWMAEWIKQFSFLVTINTFLLIVVFVKVYSGWINTRNFNFVTINTNQFILF